jgi:hypothetical protein
MRVDEKFPGLDLVLESEVCDNGYQSRNIVGNSSVGK